MRNLILTILALSTLGGCKPSREEFQEDYVAQTCALIQECLDQPLTFDSEEDCVAFYTLAMALYPSEEEGCTYDADAGAECLHGLSAVTCDTIDRGEPIACQGVFAGEGCVPDITW